MRFDKTLLITDADGTLLTDDKRILPGDMAAIREFVDNGGLFTIATGRGVTLARCLAEELNLQIPAVIFNGAAVYDYAKNRFLWQDNLPETAIDYMKLFIKQFPTAGVEILRGDDIFVTSTNRWEEDHIAYGKTNPIRCNFDDVPRDKWIKTLLVDEPENIDEIVKFASELNLQDVHLVRSGTVFFEILPKGANKGSGFKKMLELAEIRDRYIVAAGDFMNDLEMIEMADLGVAVSNAEQCVKLAAKLIVCDNNSGAVRDIVGYLKGR
ncbi:MAG: HAD family hydrolase [Oscillospiraceae bacterium]|nr:HAD family hydrolase [Oscillospiraceae bacterium]